MKKLITIILLAPILILGQTNKRNFIEGNVGLASIYGYDFNEAFPGLSVLYGKTFEKNGLITELQVGLAAPSVMTGKIGLGIGSLENNFQIAVRPWPFFIGPQIKLNKLSFSVEVGTDSWVSFDSGLITTIGYRWDINKKNK